MKKLTLICAGILACGTLAACGNNAAQHSSKTASSSSKTIKKQSSKKQSASSKKSSVAESNSSESDNSSQQTGTSSDQQSQQSSQQATESSSDNGHVTIAGHSYHHEDFYGNDILVGDNGEGEAQEYIANDLSLNQDQRDAALSQTMQNATYGRDKE